MSQHKQHRVKNLPLWERKRRMAVARANRRRKGKAPYLTPAVEKSILADVLAGVPVYKAFICAGIGQRTGFTWLASRPAFRAKVEKAEAECMRDLVREIRGAELPSGGKDWRARWALLSRRFRSDFGDEKAGVSVAVTSNVTVALSAAEIGEIQKQREAALLHGRQ